jgi:bifunctional N-acetylglucosamine-1-phosphate-uridyltransferase/glucosamine-1-phosphate-acetyltransferase GlmU-like protein
LTSARSNPTLIVLAAGIGSRYGGLKQVDPVGPNGELIVDYSVYDALRAGFFKVVFVINEQIEKAFRERVGKNIEKKCETVYVLQQVQDVPAGFQLPPNRLKPWGTAHATLACRNVVDGNVAVINADDFYGRSSYQALHDYLAQARDDAEVYDFCMIGFVLLNTLTEHGHVARGVCSVDENGFLREIHERTRIRQFGQVARYSEDGVAWIDIPPAAVASLNMWGFTPGLFSELEARFPRFLRESTANLEKAEFFLPEVVGNLIREGKAKVKVLPTQERWFGVTYQQDRPQVKQAIQDLIGQGVYPENLWGGAR